MIPKRLAAAVVIAGSIIAAAAILRYAEGAGMLEPDGARRTMQVMIGLLGAAYGNFMPKRVGPARSSPQAETRAQAALRVGGWSFTAGGLAYAGLWAFAPLAFADAASTVVVAAAMAVTVSYALWAFIVCRRAGNSSFSRP